MRPSASIDTRIPPGKATQGPSEIGEPATLHRPSPRIQPVSPWWGHKDCNSMWVDTRFEARRAHTFGILGYFVLDNSGAQLRCTHTSISVYPHHSLASFSAQSLWPKRKPVSLQLENGLCSTHTDSYTALLRIKPASLPCSLPVGLLLVFLCKPVLNHWWGQVLWYKWKDWAKERNHHQTAEGALVRIHILKIPPSSGRY